MSLRRSRRSESLATGQPQLASKSSLALSVSVGSPLGGDRPPATVRDVCIFKNKISSLIISDWAASISVYKYYRFSCVTIEKPYWNHRNLYHSNFEISS